MTAHTPAPWQIYDTVQGLYITKQGTHSICKINVNQHNHPEWDADARLIVEAPDMLELIRTLADAETGRNPSGIIDAQLGQWAEEILARVEKREPVES